MSIKIGFVHELGIESAMVRKFYEENWERKIALSEKAFYEWQFIQPPKNSGADHCVVAYDENRKKVLGVMGLHARDFFLSGVTKTGAELTTWIVSAEVAGSGLGARILMFIQSRFEVLIGMGISEAAIPIYLRCGFRYLKNIPRFIKVINFDRIKPYSQYNHLAGKLIKAWKPKLRGSYQTTTVTSGSINDFNEKIKREYNLFSRDWENLLWRYSDHPYFKYTQFLVRKSSSDKDGRAYIAIREERSLRDFRILHVMDFFGSADCMDCGIDFIHTLAEEHDFDVIDFYCTSSEVYRFMLSNGWFSITDDNCFQFPHLFHPIEMRTPPTTSLIYWSKENFADIANLSRLYITKQDSDLDRPTLHTLNSSAYGLAL